MYVIRGSANGDCFHVVCAGDAAEVRPEVCLQLRRYEWKPFLSAEHAVHEIANIRMRHCEALLSIVRFADLLAILHLIPAMNRWAVRLRAREVREVQVLFRHTLSGL